MKTRFKCSRIHTLLELNSDGTFSSFLIRNSGPIKFRENMSLDTYQTDRLLGGDFFDIKFNAGIPLKHSFYLLLNEDGRMFRDCYPDKTKHGDIIAFKEINEDQYEFGE